MPVKQKDNLSTRLKKLTKNELEKRDTFGRTILHVVCIVGRFDLLKALLRNQHLNSTVTDCESGWTGLHYSIFYGRLSCARLLLDHNYNLMMLKDRSGLTAMDIYHSKYAFRDLKIFPEFIGEKDTSYKQRLNSNAKTDDKLIWWDKNKRGGSEVFTYGINVNNHLGTGDSVDKTLSPYRVEIPNLRLHDTSLSIADRLVASRIKDIKLSKNHSVILTNEANHNILTAGNPSRGRLGNGSSSPNFRFTHMEALNDKHIVDVAISDDHTLALTSEGEVFSWGLNNYYELGFNTEKIKDKNDTYSDEPKRVLGVLKRLKVQGISCSKIHSCAFTKDSVVIWGLNVGQMDFISTGDVHKYGKLKGIIQIPRLVSFSGSIRQVIATDESTIVLLSNNECHILTNGNHLKFQIPLYKSLNNEFEFFRPSVFSKKRHIIKLVSKDSTKIGILYDDGSISTFGVDMFSKSSNIKYISVWKPRNDHLKAIDVDIGRDGSVIICTKSGCVYKRVSRASGNDYKFTKIAKASKIVKVSCDSLFSSFGFIKDDVDQLPMQLYKNKFLKDIAYLSPLTISDQTRKQHELVNPSFCDDYTLNFLSRPDVEINNDDEYSIIFNDVLGLDEDEDEDEDEDDSNDNKANDSKDLIFEVYKNRWKSIQPLKSTLASFSQEKYFNLLFQEDLKTQLNSADFQTGKGYDWFFEIDGLSIGAHSFILLFIEGFEKIETEDLKYGNAIFEKIDQYGNIKVEGVSLHTLLLLLHFLYTGKILTSSESFQSNQTISFLEDIKKESETLFKHFRLIDDFKRPIYNLSEKFKDSNNFENDTTILLKDGDIIQCNSHVLRARNAYFETFFSERWDESNVLEFQHVSRKSFQIALDYMHGHEQLSLLDSLYEIKTSTDFINVIFEIIELSDELLLFGLKDFCQLMVKDFIKQDNVLLILHHAEILNCRKLVGQCLWFIYNNVETFLTDQSYEELISEGMTRKIDSYCRWLHRVNKANPEHTKTSWYDGDSDDLLEKFMFEMRDFNDIFLESDNFVPLFDIQPKKEKDKAPKLESKKSKTPSLPQIPTPIVSEKIRQTSINSASSSRKSSFNDSSVIEFTDDDFQPVTKSRHRKSSSSNRRPSNDAAFFAITNRPSITNNTTNMNMNSRPSSIPINKPTTQSKKIFNNFKNSWNESPVALSPLSNWASQGNTSNLGSSNFFDSYSPLSKHLTGSSSAESKGNNITFGAGATIKLSQKERKKLMKQNEVLKSDDNNNKESLPWKIPSISSSITDAKSPSLEALRKEELQSNAKPSLKGIRHEEEHKIYEIKMKETERKSLADVQKEEEFAIWWEEESRKVQNQLNNQTLFANEATSTMNGFGGGKGASFNKNSNLSGGKKSFPKKKVYDKQKNKSTV